MAGCIKHKLIGLEYDALCCRGAYIVEKHDELFDKYKALESHREGTDGDEET